MKIEKVKINDIVPYENNAKKHPQEQIEQIKRSILEFGNNDPIAIDEKNIVIEGHGRLEALIQLGYKEADCIRLNHLSEEQKKAYILVHNKLTLNTDFDINILSLELEELENMNVYGFDDFIGDDFSDEFSLDNNNEPLAKTITFTLSTAQYDIVDKAINSIELTEYDGIDNKNKNGNRLYKLVKEWENQRKI